MAGGEGLMIDFGQGDDVHILSPSKRASVTSREIRSKLFASDEDGRVSRDEKRLSNTRIRNGSMPSQRREGLSSSGGSRSLSDSIDTSPPNSPQIHVPRKNKGFYRRGPQLEQHNSSHSTLQSSTRSSCAGSTTQINLVGDCFDSRGNVIDNIEAEVSYTSAPSMVTQQGPQLHVAAPPPTLTPFLVAPDKRADLPEKVSEMISEEAMKRNDETTKKQRGDSKLSSDPCSEFGLLDLRETEPRKIQEQHINMLKLQGFPTGLAKTLIENTKTFDHRIWLIDNSGSMMLGDGHRIVEDKKKGSTGMIRSVECTRWEELQDTVKYHAQMAALMDSPVVFRLLNFPGERVGQQQFSVADRGESKYEEDIQNAFKVMKRAKPEGATPLTQHIKALNHNLRRMAPELRRAGKKVVVIIATDGLPTDDQGFQGKDAKATFMKALKTLEGLPIWLVVRLCTDDERVTEFYNALDNEIEVPLEVLDDFVGEAEEVRRCNKWLNYALPLHRCRELGYHDRLFDFIDERTLTRGEVRDFCCLLFGIDNEGYEIPDPSLDWKGFLSTIHTLLKSEQEQWNPVKKRMMPWIDLRVLSKMYGDGTCNVM